MSVEDDDWATAVDIQEGLTKVELKESTKPEGDDFTTVSLSISVSIKLLNDSSHMAKIKSIKEIKAFCEKFYAKN